MILVCSLGHQYDTSDPRWSHLTVGKHCPCKDDDGRCGRMLRDRDYRAGIVVQREKRSGRMKKSLRLDPESLDAAAEVQELIPGIESDSAAVDHLIQRGIEAVREEFRESG